MKKLKIFALAVILLITAAGVMCAIYIRDSFTEGGRTGLMAEISDAFEREYKLKPEDSTVEMFAAVLRVMAEITGGRLTAYEVVRSFITVYDTASGRNGEYNRLASTTFMMDKSAVRAAYSVIEDTKAVRGKLSDEEKLLYAYLAVYIMENGTDNLTAGTLKEAMRSERERSPEKFAFYDREKRLASVSADFAVTRENPVKAASIGHSYRYLERLRTPSGGRVSYKRNGSMEGADGGIIDSYTLTFAEASGDKRITIFIDPYCAENSHKAPAGLVYKD
ncbi:MAG: hypothetical protein IJP86_04150 [Synergistaceae bacterium]|nr:hypothetical protein [Synergistaceae bacterium]